jgi:hypothetical protein
MGKSGRLAGPGMMGQKARCCMLFSGRREKKKKKRGDKLGGLGCRGQNKRFSDQKERGGNWAKEFDF